MFISCLLGEEFIAFALVIDSYPNFENFAFLSKAEKDT